MVRSEDVNLIGLKLQIQDDFHSISYRILNKEEEYK